MKWLEGRHGTRNSTLTAKASRPAVTWGGVWMAALLVTLFAAGCRTRDQEERPSPKDYSRRTFTEGQPRKLCVFMDGTMNTPGSQTHVRRLYEIVSAKRAPDIICYYDVGVGADKKLISGAIGGLGFTENVAEAYTFLGNNYRTGDKIYIFGFSRGARQAQVLCDLIDARGLVKFPKDPYEKSRDLIRAYKKVCKKAKDQGKRPEWENQPGEPIQIEFVGLWDCVEALGNSLLNTARHKGIDKGEYQDHYAYNYELPECILRAYHAMALDEKRGLYEVIKWRLPENPRPGNIVEQVWFPGSHGDVGGGYPVSQTYSGFSLNWIMSKLEADQLLPAPGFRVEASAKAYAVDSSAFKLAGETLSKLRDNQVRTNAFWYDCIVSEQNGVLTKRLQETKPLVHVSVIERMHLDNVVVNSGKTNNVVPYRPDQFRDEYSSNSGIYQCSQTETVPRVNFELLKSRIVVVE